MMERGTNLYVLLLASRAVDICLAVLFVFKQQKTGEKIIQVFFFNTISLETVQVD